MRAGRFAESAAICLASWVLRFSSRRNGFTFSKSQGGRTLFTLHAAKTVQYKGGGHAILHDVSITLYGAQGGSVDHIYGDDFDYDPVKWHRPRQRRGPDRSSSPGSLQSPAAGAPSDASKSTVHVKTAGLIFNEKTGMASTSQRFEFELPQAKGSAVGASFDSTTGVLILESDIALDSSLDGGPIFFMPITRSTTAPAASSIFWPMKRNMREAAAHRIRLSCIFARMTRLRRSRRRGM